MSPFLQSFIFSSDKLGRVSFADEDFQQPQLGFNVFVFVVLHCQWWAVLFLHISVGCRWGQQTERRLSSGKKHYFFYEQILCFLLPSILPKELVLKIFQNFTDSLFLLSGLLELLHKLLPVTLTIEMFKYINTKKVKCAEISPYICYLSKSNNKTLEYSSTSQN